MHAVVSPHIVRNRRHAEGGSVEKSFVETLVTVAGAEAEIRAMTALSCAGHRVRIDPVARIAWHSDGHADPIVPFEVDGETCVQAFLIDLKPACALGAVEIESAKGRQAVVTRREMARLEREPMQTTLVKEAPGRWFVEVISDEPFEAIQQTTRFGRACETMSRHPAGRHRLRVGPGFCESWGLALSTVDVEGGVEHKHMLFGKFGNGSGRHLMDAGVLFAPKVVHPFAYRSLIARVDTAGLPGGSKACWDGFDEVEVWARATEITAARDAMHGCPVPWRLTVYGHDGAEEAVEADVLIADPDLPAPEGRPFSFLLFADAASEGFGARLSKAAARARELDESYELLDRSWFAAEEGRIDPKVVSHGVAFSLPDRGLSLVRGAVIDTRRKVMVDSPCNGCEWESRCEGILPFPYPPALLPAPDCGLKAAFAGRRALEAFGAAW